MITWRSPHTKTSRQIDYIAIDHMCRNAVKKANVVPGWTSNMEQRKHHGVVQMGIRLRLMAATRKTSPETGRIAQYDIKNEAGSTTNHHHNDCYRSMGAIKNAHTTSTTSQLPHDPQRNHIPGTRMGTKSQNME